MRYDKKNGQESPVKGHNCGFLPLIFPNLGHLERCNPLIVENKAFDLSKKALRAVTARNEWLKKSPDGPGNKKHMSEASSKNAEILFRSSRS